MKLADMKLVPGVMRPPLGQEVERTITDDQVAEGRGKTLESIFAHRLVDLDEQANGDVVITAPDGITIRVYSHAIESKKEK